jgi:hypothetical protein
LRARLIGVIGLSLLASASESGAALTIASGEDCWTTTPPSTAQITVGAGQLTAPGGRVSVGQTTTIPVTGVPLVGCPCSCTQPFIQWTDRHGNPVQPGDKHGVAQTATPTGADTCVRRVDAAPLSGVGVPVPVDVQMVCLHLTGTMLVDMSPNPDCTYTVDVQLNGSQSQGSLAFTPTSPDLNVGTASLGSLPVGAQATFTPTSGCNPGVTGATTTFSNTPGTYFIDIVPSLSAGKAVLLAVGFLALGIVLMVWYRHRTNAVA